MKFIVKLIVSAFSILIGFFFILLQGRLYVSEAAKGYNKPFHYFFIMVLIAILFFIIIPFILNIIVTSRVKKPLLLKGVLYFIKNQIPHNNYEVETPENTNHIKNNDDRIYEYFVYNYSTEDINNQRTAYNYNVNELRNSIAGILDEIHHLTDELIKYKDSEMRNKLAAIKTRNNNVTVEYLSDNNIEITSGIITINVPLYKCKSLNQFYDLAPYLRTFYLKPKKYTL